VVRCTAGSDGRRRRWRLGVTLLAAALVSTVAALRAFAYTSHRAHTVLVTSQAFTGVENGNEGQLTALAYCR